MALKKKSIARSFKNYSKYFVTLLAGSKVSDRCPLGYVFLCTLPFFFFLFFLGGGGGGRWQHHACSHIGSDIIARMMSPIFSADLIGSILYVHVIRTTIKA